MGEFASKLVEDGLQVPLVESSNRQRQAKIRAGELLHRASQGGNCRIQVEGVAPNRSHRAFVKIDMEPGCPTEALQDGSDGVELGGDRFGKDHDIVRVERDSMLDAKAVQVIQNARSLRDPQHASEYIHYDDEKQWGKGPPA
jgi:hypothetical protein